MISMKVENPNSASTVVVVGGMNQGQKFGERVWRRFRSWKGTSRGLWDVTERLLMISPECQRQLTLSGLIGPLLGD